MLINLLIFLIIVGALLWLINSVIPMEAWVKQVANVVAIVIIVITLIRALLGYGYWW